MSRSVLGALAGLAALIIAPKAEARTQLEAPSAASPSPPPAEPVRSDRKAGVSVVLFGGVVGPNLAAILAEADNAGVVLPTRDEIVGSRGSICGVLVRLNYPPPCDLLFPMMRRVNGRAVDAEVLQPEQSVLVPDISLRIDRRKRVFTAQEAAKLARTTRNWKLLNVQLSAPGRADIILEYDAYSIVLPVDDDQAAEALTARLRGLNLDNTSVSEHLKAPSSLKLFAASGNDGAVADALRTECEGASGVNQRSYADWLSEDRVSRVAVSAVPQRASTVVLIDTQLNAGPNLTAAMPAEGAKPDWKCAWRKPDAADHGTYLAGIIASRPNGYGFEGVAPATVLESTPLAQLENGQLTPLDDAFERVGEVFDAGTNGHLPLKTYLVALDFGIWAGKQYNSSLLLQPVLIRTINDARRPLVMAAGQSQNGSPGVEISADSPLTPQNLGNRDYAISVTACLDCAGDAVRLMPEANFSSGNHRFVHVAAPGGGPVPGWFGPDGMGVDTGTSPASAFAAGVVARMAATWPEHYTEARQLKERIQTTSRPLPLYVAGPQPNPDINKLAAGVVDPYVALLDPRETWVRAGGQWKSIKLKSINIALLDSSNDPAGGEAKWLRRLVRAPDPVNGAVWTAMERARHDTTAIMGDVTTLYAVRPSPASTMTPCVGPPIPVATFDDILLPAGGLKGAQCGP